MHIASKLVKHKYTNKIFKRPSDLANSQAMYCRHWAKAEIHYFTCWYASCMYQNSTSE